MLGWVRYGCVGFVKTNSTWVLLCEGPRTVPIMGRSIKEIVNVNLRIKISAIRNKRCKLDSFFIQYIVELVRAMMYQFLNRAWGRPVVDPRNLHMRDIFHLQSGKKKF